MTIREIMDRGLEISRRAAEMLEETPIPVDDLLTLYEEWNRYHKEFFDQAKAEPAEKRNALCNFYYGVANAIDQPIVWALKGKRHRPI